jgi:hypothetical protein
MTPGWKLTKRFSIIITKYCIPLWDPAGVSHDMSEKGEFVRDQQRAEFRLTLGLIQWGMVACIRYHRFRILKCEAFPYTEKLTLPNIWRCVFNSDVKGGNLGPQVDRQRWQSRLTTTCEILRWRQKRKISVPISATDWLEGCNVHLYIPNSSQLTLPVWPPGARTKNHQTAL